MPHQRNPNEPYPPPHDPGATARADDRARTAAQEDSELQPDLELVEGPASTTRITLYAIAAILILTAVFYGLNSSMTGTETAGQAPPASTATPQADSTGIRNVTPSRNAQQPGTTTGAAPSSSPAQGSSPPAAGGNAK